MRNLIYIAALLSLTSCSNVLAFLLGINPNYKSTTKVEVIKYAQKYKYDPTHIYILTKKASDSIRSVPYKPGQVKGERPIQFKVFDRNGKLITFYASCEGPYAQHWALDSFPTRGVNYTDPSWTISKEIKNFRSLINDSTYTVPKQKPDMYIVAYWATFLGIPDRSMIHKLKKYMKKHRDHKIKMILVNEDIINGVNGSEDAMKTKIKP